MARWEASWELEFPATTSEDLLLALVVRDLLHGTSYDVELADSGGELSVEFVAGDELAGDCYHLLIAAEVDGPEDHAMVQNVAEQILDELIEEAERLVEGREELAEVEPDQLAFRAVSEDQERLDMVLPDWLAPDDAVVPFGFRPFLKESDDPWPADEQTAGRGRVVVVPHGGVVRLYSIPASSLGDETQG